MDDMPFPLQLFKMLKPVEKCWQPQDFLPDPSSDTFLDEVGLAMPILFAFVWVFVVNSLTGADVPVLLSLFGLLLTASALSTRLLLLPSSIYVALSWPLPPQCNSKFVMSDHIRCPSPGSFLSSHPVTQGLIHCLCAGQHAGAMAPA